MQILAGALFVGLLFNPTFRLVYLCILFFSRNFSDSLPGPRSPFLVVASLLRDIIVRLQIAKASLGRALLHNSHDLQTKAR